MRKSDHASPLVSLLSTVHNEELYISEFLESILRQDYPNWELLIVDDGSTDATAALIEEYALRDDRISLISKGVKLGKVAAFNLAFTHSTGDLIALTPGDDVLPQHSVAARARAFEGFDHSVPTVGYFKLRTISPDPGFAGRILPRGSRGSRSGPGLVMNRVLAKRLFPIPQHLPSADSWLTPGTYVMSKRIVHSPDIVLDYRIHPGNSNPRHKSFAEMSEAISKRAEGSRLLLDKRGEEIPEAARRVLESRVALEERRREGSLLKIMLTPGAETVDKLAAASMSKSWLWRLRQRFYIQLSGWRGK